MTASGVEEAKVRFDSKCPESDFKMKILLTFLVASFCFADSVFADIVDVIANGAGANVETISQIVLDVDSGTGSITQIQNVPISGPTQTANSAFLRSITLSSGVLTQFNPSVPTVTNHSFPSTASGIQVMQDGVAIGVGDPEFLETLAQVHSNGDLLNYLRVDGGDFTPQWDIQYDVPIEVDDYLVVEERDGNTTFTVEALDSNGGLIADADLLSFDGNSYQWSIGLANAADPFSDQPQVLSVLSLDLFSTTTPIQGFRISNTGNADFKFFVASAIPEPGSLGLLSVLSLSILLRRRRLPSL